METDSPVVYHGTSESRFPPESAARSQMQLSPEEIRTLRECNKESFYYRCLPYAIAGMTATFLAVKQGYLKGHPKWGPAGKMTGAAFGGWLLGKFSYRKACEDKFLKLENSQVGDAIRKRRGYSSETFESENRFQTPVEDNITVKDNYNSYGKDDYRSGSFNLDVDKNVQNAGLDDRERPSTDRQTYEYKDENKPLRSFSSYEEMRRRNREDYERQQMRPQYNKSTPSSGTEKQQRWKDSNEEKTSFSQGGPSTNQYGDSWDNPKFT